MALDLGEGAKATTAIGGRQETGMRRPRDDEYGEFYRGYVGLVSEEDVLTVLAGQTQELRDLAAHVPADRETFRYGADKWSIREVMGHVADAERVFGYRAFCISRGEQASLPAFDENTYVEESGYDRRPLRDLVELFASLRAANLAELRAIGPAVWGRVGTANHAQVSVRALAFILAGHVRHHCAILSNRYELTRAPAAPPS
jgi:hypothetical protein